MNMKNWLWIVITTVAWLGLSACGNLPLKEPRWYTIGRVDKVLNWEWADALTIIRKQECPQTAFQYADKDWKLVVVIQDDCKTKSQWI